MKTALKLAFVGIISLQFLAIIARAATSTVYVVNFDFVDASGLHIDPAINLGDTVTWVLSNGTHTSTSSAGQLESWGSAILSTNAPFSHTFSQLGTFNYHCSIHGFDAGCRQAGAMSGHITVSLGALTTPYTITTFTNSGNDIVVNWITGGICETNVLQRSPGAGDGSFSTNFVDIFTLTNTTGNVTNYVDPGAATNFPNAYYRVRVPQ